jgi:spore coat polysaccharide biosynthesis predicted glycosyltransferase SpsG
VFAICVEASHARGMGHLFRALVIADALERRGNRVIFLVNECPAAREVLAKTHRRFEVETVAYSRGDWEASILHGRKIKVWINDRKDTDAAHVDRLKRAGLRVATFDDSGTGALVSDMNIVAIPSERGGVAGKCVLRGLEYLVLDPAIGHHRRLRKVVRSVAIAMGGSDTYGLTVEVVRALQNDSRALTVVLGPGFRHDSELQPLLDRRITVRRGVESLAAELSPHDLAITAGGMTLFEACAAGLPCIAIAAEDWEAEAIKVLARAGACADAGNRLAFDRKRLASPVDVESMSKAGMNLLDLRGVERVIDAVTSL